jgi:hypothetical protein
MVLLEVRTLVSHKARVASIGSGRAARRGFERWLGPDVSPASIYLEDA